MHAYYLLTMYELSWTWTGQFSMHQGKENNKRHTVGSMKRVDAWKCI